jgi:hypothetical protein
MMIELKNDSMEFTFPNVHNEAKLTISFQRTFRIPDDETSYSLPPGLGRFSLKHVDDHSDNIPSKWIERGGILLPMYQSEAMWIKFDSERSKLREVSYPFAIKVAAGKINAATGEGWSKGLSNSPQNYIVAPEQPWLDGFHTDKDNVRQFVATNLGSGYTAEEQITGSAEYGGLQIMVFPMKPEVFEMRYPKIKRHGYLVYNQRQLDSVICGNEMPSMGLAPGGRMRQKIYSDPFRIDDWDQDNYSRCFVHLTNSLVWQDVTGEKPNHPPITAKRYNQYGLPWFDYYDEGSESIDKSKKLAELKSIVEMAKLNGTSPLPENQSVIPKKIIHLIKPTGKNIVREGSF